MDIRWYKHPGKSCQEQEHVQQLRKFLVVHTPGSWVKVGGIQKNWQVNLKKIKKTQHSSCLSNFQRSLFVNRHYQRLRERITVGYKVRLASSYRWFSLASIVIQKSHTCQYESQDKIIHKNPIRFYSFVANPEQDQTQPCHGYDPWKVPVFTWSIYCSGTNSTRVKTIPSVVPWEDGKVMQAK